MTAPTFVFAVQPGPLEAQALVLAASIRDVMGSRPNLIAGMPRPPADWGGRINWRTHRHLLDLGVRIDWFDPSVGPAYPLGNKPGLTSLLPDTGGIIIDTDHVCVSPMPDLDLGPDFVAVKPGEINSFHEDWPNIYGSIGLPMPTHTVVSSVTGESMPPWYLTSFVAFGARSNVPFYWPTMTRAVYDGDALHDKFWSEQVGLSLAIARDNADVLQLSHQHTFPVPNPNNSDPRYFVASDHFPPINWQDPPYFLHYHNRACLDHHPRVSELVARYELATRTKIQ